MTLTAVPKWFSLTKIFLATQELLCKFLTSLIKADKLPDVHTNAAEDNFKKCFKGTGSYLNVYESDTKTTIQLWC